MPLRILSVFLMAILLAQTQFGQTQERQNTNTAVTIGDGDQRVENLRKTVEELRDAFNRNDFERFADLTVPEVIKQVGGRENLISMIKKVSEMNPRIFEDFSMTYGDPGDLVKRDDFLLAIVPQTIVGVTFEKHKVVDSGCVVGVSVDGGTLWKFASCEKFFDAFPKMDGAIAIPKETITVDGVKQ